MIRLSDAAVLAYTKLRVHKIRTGIAVVIAGLLFGLIAGVIIVAQGIFSSVDRFSEEGLNNRTIVNVTRSGGTVGFNEFEKTTDKAFVTEVEAEHKAIVDAKQAAARKFQVEYAPEVEDPSPIGVDPITKQKIIKDTSLDSQAVQNAAERHRKNQYSAFDINEYLKEFSSAKVIQKFDTVTPKDGQIELMRDGKESRDTVGSGSRFALQSNTSLTLSVIDGSIAKPFVANTDFDATKGELPVIIPYGQAEQALKYKKLPAEATMDERLERLKEVRSRIGEVTASMCYRNTASSSLLAQAIAQDKEIRENAQNAAYVKPKRIYAVPEQESCGAVTVASDTRTDAEKRQDENRVLFEKEIGTYLGEPDQKKVMLRGVGISSDVSDGSGQWSVSELVKSLFGSWLAYESWVIPQDMLEAMPAAARPDAIFENNDTSADEAASQGFYFYQAYLVEFGDKDEAREILKRFDGEVFSMPFGSSALFVDEVKQGFVAGLQWAALIVGVVAIIILGSIIGRTVSEGRRESAVFRAIGASRGDIGMIYGFYVLLLAGRVILFTALLGIAAALTVEMLFWQDATTGARLAYAASDTNIEFHLFDLWSPYLLWIVGVIIAASIIASIIPILLGARRNPIKDMRNDT